MYKPAVSVIIPAYNAERFIRETLESVVRQKFKDFEVIVVDDGSTDDTANIARSFEVVRYCFQFNQGPAAARNKGFELSRGRYLSFLDADDIWHEDMLYKCLRVLESKRTVSAVHANWLYVDENGSVLPRTSGWRPWRGDIFERLLVNIPLINASTVWKRQCFEEIGGFDKTPEVNDDWLNWLRITSRGHLFDYVEEPLAFYRLHSGNLTRTNSYQVIEWRKRSLDAIFSEVEVAGKVRDGAYAQVHWVRSMAALARSDLNKATSEFRSAVVLDEDFLWRAETYYAVAYGGNGSSTQNKLEATRAEMNLVRFMTIVVNESKFEEQRSWRKDKVWGELYFHLACMAYGSSEIRPSKARVFLWRATRANRSQFVHRNRVMWALRILAGKRLVTKLRLKQV